MREGEGALFVVVEVPWEMEMLGIFSLDPPLHMVTLSMV